MCEGSSLQLVSAGDRLVQFKNFHRIDLTPALLHRIFASVSPDCWRCAAALADFIHIYWRCPQFQTFWTVIASFIPSVTTVHVPLMVYVFLLGLWTLRCIIEPLELSWGYLCFMPRTLLCSNRQVNLTLPLYKTMYLSRGCPKTIHNVCDIWVDTPSTNADPSLLLICFDLY